jgi:ABC-type sugar transport system, periplasmic component
MRKVVAIFLSLLLVVSMFSACSSKDKGGTKETTNDKPTVTKAAEKTDDGKDAEVVHIKFFTGKVETVDLINGMIKEFNAANPNIVVEQEFQKDASNVIKVKFASGDIPDIVTVVTQDYIDQGMYKDLTSEAWWNRIQPAIRDLCTDVKSGKQYKVASNMTMAGLFYNKKIFEEQGITEPKTWKEFEDSMLKIKATGVTPFFMGGKDSWMLGHLIEFMAHGVIKQTEGVTGAKLAFLNNDDSKLHFGDENGPLDSFAKALLSARDKKILNKDFLTATYDNQIEAFATGKAAVISQGMWALGAILEKNPDMANNIGFMPYPSIVEGTQPVILSAEDSAYAITSGSKHPEEAKKFLDFLFQPENLKKYSESIKSPCAFTDVTADWGPLKDAVAAALKNGVNIGFTNENPSGFSGDDAGRMVQELYADQYKSSLDFAKAYKAAWDKAYNGSKSN